MSAPLGWAFVFCSPARYGHRRRPHPDEPLGSRRSLLVGARITGALVMAALATAACASDVTTTTPSTAVSSTTSAATPPSSPPTTIATSASSTTTADAGSTSASVGPDWLGSRVLPTIPGGRVVPQTTPEELLDRRLITNDTLPPPEGDGFESSVGPLEGDALARSTWNDGCPVDVEDLAYVRVSFWGFDERPHTGELIVHVGVADDIVAVFEQLHAARFPIEEMRIVTQADLDAPPIGDGNNTSSFVCRAVTGGSRFSEHASGLAIDVNPFHNPYVKGDLVLPELATSYGDRSVVLPGMILEGDPVVAAFDAAGWGWGGRWRSLKDYQHFALNDR